MPALSLVLDYALKVSQEPGFHRQVSSRELATSGAANPDGSSSFSLWADPQTDTVMLRPLQLNHDWLNSTNQLPSIIRLAQMNVSALDLANLTIFEQPAFGNNANPWIYHYPTLPPSYYPSAPSPHPEPESGPSLVGIAPGADTTSFDLTTVRPTGGYAMPGVMTAYGSDPAPVQVISTASGIHAAQSSFRLPANRGLFLRWYQAQGSVGFPPVYTFYIGQFALSVRDVMVQVFQDVSSGGDRSSFQHVATLPLFSIRDYSTQGIAATWQAIFSPDELLGHDRSLLWLPFRRNQVLLLSSAGKSALIQTRAQPQRLPDGSDWDIVRSDTVLVWLVAPTWGRFQIQTLAYQPSAVVNVPPIYLDYAPASTPATALSIDADHGTSINSLQTQPPSYPLPLNNTRECQAVPAGASSTIQARTYGYQLTLSSDPAGQWTPFFYNLRLDSQPVLTTPSLPVPLTVNDQTASGQAIIESAEITSGLKAGEGRANLELVDPNPYPLSGYYYRCGMPIQLALDSAPVFTGYTLPTGVEPIRPLGINNPVRLHVTASDRWWQLTNYYLRDNRDWTGVGHITVVQNILQQAGVDITGMDTFALTDPQNAILGDLPQHQVANQAALQGLSPWQPHPAETAAAFLRRIADHFAGWNLGFYPDGTCFYRPRYFYTTSEVTFYESEAAATSAGHTGAPIFRNATFSVIEPEANVIMVKAISRQTGGPLYSSVWVDWASLLNPSAVNYLSGRRKVEIVEIAGSYSCAGINWAARIIWNWTRRRHLMARLDTDYSSIPKVGHVITLHGYGAYRVRSLTTHYRKRTNCWLSMEAEFVESGYG